MQTHQNQNFESKNHRENLEGRETKTTYHRQENLNKIKRSLPAGNSGNQK